MYAMLSCPELDELPLTPITSHKPLISYFSIYTLKCNLFVLLQVLVQG